MKHKYKSHKSIRKLKNKKHQILCSLKGNIRRCYSRNKNTRKKNSLSESRREIYLENYNAKRIIMGDSKKKDMNFIPNYYWNILHYIQGNF